MFVAPLEYEQYNSDIKDEKLLTLPKVIQDAIELTRRLGLRYIWIESLCIVQDDVRAWKLNNEVMDLIYNNATLTICAADGKNAESGLRALNAHGSMEKQHVEECTPGVNLMVSHLAETSIKR